MDCGSQAKRYEWNNVTSKYELRGKIFSSILNYNRMRSPEATASLLEFDEDNQSFKVEFSGPFCLSCGVRDWIEDLAYILKEEGIDAELKDYIEKDEFKIEATFRVTVVKDDGH